MKDCGIVKDLLPLVVEHMASEESTAFVKEHIETCESCRAAFDAMQAPVETEPAAPLFTVRKAVKRRGWLIAGLIACLVAALVIGCAARLLKPFSIQSENDAFDAIRIERTIDADPETQNDGEATLQLVLTANRSVETVAVSVNAEEVCVTAITTLWREMVGTNSEPVQTVIPLYDVDGVYYEPFDNTDRIALYQREGYTPEAGFALPRLVMNYYFLIAVIGTAILAVVWLVLRLCKKKNASRVLGVLLLIAASGTLAFLVAGFPATTIAPVRELTFVLVITVLLIGAGLCGRKLLRKE